MIAPTPYAQFSWPSGTTALTALRTTLRTFLYAEGWPTSGATSTVPSPVGFIKLSGCASITQYVQADAGGRSGGDPLYTYLLVPTATPIGVLFVCCYGHAPYVWDDDPDNAMLLAALAAGMHVLVVEEPARGSNVNPMHVVVGGVLTEFDCSGGHNLLGIDADHGPPSYRFFIDHAIKGINEALANESLGIEHICIFGFSGGSFASTILGALDTRIVATYCLAGIPVGAASTGDGSWGDMEGWQHSSLANLGALEDNLVVLGAAGGRRRVEVRIDDDDQTPSSRFKHEALDASLARRIAQLGDAGGSIAYWYDTTATSHWISPETAAAVVADILNVIGGP